jgi:hypothetical protein
MISQGIVGTLFGTVLGAILTFCVTSFNQWRQSRKQRTIATMQLVSNLRCWMREMTWRIDQTKLAVDSEGHDGTAYSELPNFHFETSLEQISFLKHTTAIRLLQLIHEKDATNINFKWSMWCEHDVDDGSDLFHSQSAKLFLDAAALCNRMSRQVGWSDEVFFDGYKAMMKDEIERREKINKSPVAVSLDAA